MKLFVVIKLNWLIRISTFPNNSYDKFQAYKNKISICPFNIAYANTLNPFTYLAQYPWMAISKIFQKIEQELINFC